MTYSEPTDPESSESITAGAGTGTSAGETIRPIGSDEAPSTAAVLAVADATGMEPLELSPPLHAFVDPDAMDAIVVDGDNRITFDAYGHRVVVASDAVEVRRQSAGPTAGPDARPTAEEDDY